MFTEEEIQALRLTFATDGWTKVIAPRLASRAREAIKALILHPSERSGEFQKSNADLRAIIREDEWLLVAFDNAIKAFEHNRRRDELEAAEQRS